MNNGLKIEGEKQISQLELTLKQKKWGRGVDRLLLLTPVYADADVPTTQLDQSLAAMII